VYRQQGCWEDDSHPPVPGEGGGGQANPRHGVHLWQEDQPQPTQGQPSGSTTERQTTERLI